MWLFTKNGYYSIVQDSYCKHDEVVIRARVEKDLIDLMKEASINYALTKTPYADYKFRIIIKKEDLKKFINDYIDKLDYNNFKNSIKDKRRSRYYGNIWAELFEMGEDLN